MGRYRAADILLPPGLISLVRIPLAAAFPWVVTHPPWAVAVLAAAGISDVLDGWVARRFSMATATGAVVDGITDKLFVATVAITLLVGGYFDPVDILLLSTREILELPLVVWWAVHHTRRRLRAEDPKANGVGKGATVLQFATVVALLLGHPIELMLWSTAAAGSVAAIVYWKRELTTVDASRMGTDAWR